MCTQFASLSRSVMSLPTSYQGGAETIAERTGRQGAASVIGSLTALIAELRGLLKDLRLDTRATVGVCVTLGIVFLAAHWHGRKIFFVLQESELARLVFCRATAGEPAGLCGPAAKVEPEVGPPFPPPPVVSPPEDRTSLISQPVKSVKIRPSASEALYVASGLAVQPGDVLYVRKQPRHLARAIGSIAPEGVTVKATGARHRRPSGIVWIEVRHLTYGVGWVNARYLRRVN